MAIAAPAGYDRTEPAIVGAAVPGMSISVTNRGGTIVPLRKAESCHSGKPEGQLILPYLSEAKYRPGGTGTFAEDVRGPYRIGLRGTVPSTTCQGRVARTQLISGGRANETPEALVDLGTLNRATHVNQGAQE